MSEKPQDKERTLAVIKQEYVDLCALAGDQHFKVEAAKNMLHQTTQRLATLQNEFLEREKAFMSVTVVPVGDGTSPDPKK